MEYKLLQQILLNSEELKTKSSTRWVELTEDLVSRYAGDVLMMLPVLKVDIKYIPAVLILNDITGKVTPKSIFIPSDSELDNIIANAL